MKPLNRFLGFPSTECGLSYDSNFGSARLVVDDGVDHLSLRPRLPPSPAFGRSNGLLLTAASDSAHSNDVPAAAQDAVLQAGEQRAKTLKQRQRTLPKVRRTYCAIAV
jgi:hypothetical protein